MSSILPLNLLRGDYLKSLNLILYVYKREPLKRLKCIICVDTFLYTYKVRYLGRYLYFLVNLMLTSNPFFK